MRVRLSRVVVVGVAVVGMSGLTAPTVSAGPVPAGLRCGYATAIEVGSQCPNGDTNPPTAVAVGATPEAQRESGVVIVSQDDAETTRRTPAGEAAQDKIGSAPKSVANLGATVKPRTQADRNTSYVVLIKRNNGPYNNIGTVESNSQGFVTLPAVKLTRGGTYTFALRDAAGKTWYVRTETVDEPTVTITCATKSNPPPPIYYAVTVTWAGAPATGTTLRLDVAEIGSGRSTTSATVNGSQGSTRLTFDGGFATGTDIRYTVTMTTSDGQTAVARITKPTKVSGC